MEAGDTFIFVERGIDAHRHLWAVISDPLIDVAAPVVIVSFTTYKKGKDGTCILQPGDHPFIKHCTVVNYRGAVDVSNSGLEGCANNSSLVLQGRLKPPVLERIREGAAVSPFIPEGCRKILSDQGLIDG